MDLLYERGIRPGGLFSPEIRERGRRIGFAIVDVATQDRGILAHILQRSGPRIGKYRVNLSDIRDIGARAIDKALETADYVVCDEIGPMELFSSDLEEAIKRALKHRKPLLGTIHWRMRHPLIDRIKSDNSSLILTVTETNRDKLHEVVAEKLIKAMPPPK